MKKLIPIFLISIAISCNSDKQEIAEIMTFASGYAANHPGIVNSKNPDIPPGHDIPEPEPEPEILPAKLAIYNNSTVYFYDGLQFTEWRTGQAKYVEPGKIAVDDILYMLDEYGNEISSIQLPAIPSGVKYSGSDFWLAETIPAEFAYASGALYKDYTQIYKNHDAVGHWSQNQWIASELIKTESGEIIAQKLNDAFVAINSTIAIEKINSTTENGPLFYNHDPILRTGRVKMTGGIQSISWATNHFNNAKYWLFANNEWQSQNGYKFSESAGLTENVTALQDFNAYPYPIELPWPEAPRMISAGVRSENSEDVTYWIECNTGWLLRYVNSINELQQKFQLYPGDGYAVTGNLHRESLKPVIVENTIYFYYNGSIWSSDLGTGTTAVFYAGNAEFWGW
jgi:hypothetical protein